MKKNKKRIIFVIAFLVIFSLYLFITIRGEYLEFQNIGEKYTEIFIKNIKFKVIILMINAVFVYICTYITTKVIKKGLKSFFVEEKKEMPKLPNKSISLVLATITSMLTLNVFTQKALLAFSNAKFNMSDPIFNLDISYYMFQKPFIELIILYIIVLIAILSIYIIAYYIIAFNMFFQNGIDIETLKKNTVIKQLITNVIVIAFSIAVLIIIKSQNIVLDNFLNLKDGTALVGAGLIDVTIKVWGNRIFALVVFVCTILALRAIKINTFKKVFFWFAMIPAYLVIFFLIIVSVDFIYIGQNEFDKEKKYIEYNIQFTKNAYNINIEEIDLQSTGTITKDDISENQKVIDNLGIINKTTTLSNLNKYQTSVGYYSYPTTQLGIYNINNKDRLVYITPREIVSNDSRTYNNKTYEYTHGYGIIATSATGVDENGNVMYLQKYFVETNSEIQISEPRIYFGLQTNELIITNSDNNKEYDYPLTSTTNTTNNYDGVAGTKLNFIDRLILGINQGNVGLAFSNNITQNSTIITNRNIINRAKKIMPYLLYDENPYMVVSNSGELIWVLDAYTISNNYPYSQKSIIEYGEEKQKINYIRNSVKVLINSYNGTMKFYVTDRTDPIIMAYWNLYPTLFETLDAKLPEDILKNVVYPKYIYDIQAEILQTYHNIQPEVLYRTDDVWSIAKENVSKVSSVSGTNIEPYYTMLKTIDSSESKLGLVIPYTSRNNQNILSYLVGNCQQNGNTILKLYKFSSETPILGTMQLDTLIEQDEKISSELETLNISGTKIVKNIVVIPINNTLLYIEPIYQIMINETDVPILKKVIVASGSKLAIGNTFIEALNNLLSQDAVNIKVETEDIEGLIEQIIEANKNLQQSNESNDWEMIGKDIAKLQELVLELEKLTKKQNEDEKNKNLSSEIVNYINTNNE